MVSGVRCLVGGDAVASDTEGGIVAVIEEVLDDLTGDCLVDWRFFLSWSRCPFAVAMEELRSDSFISSIPGDD